MPARSEDEPIDENERFIRLVWKHEIKSADKLHYRGFKPKQNESDGISLFRVDCVDDWHDVLRIFAPEVRDFYGVVTVSKVTLSSLGFSVTPNQIDAVPGHCLVPEICLNAWKEDAGNLKHRMDQLVKAADTQILRLPIQ